MVTAAADRFRHLDSDNFDAIVVGAGLGGLTSAAILARQGKRVLVLDQHYVAGGCATVFKRPGYEFDVGLHYIGDCSPSGQIPRVLKEAGVELDFLPMSHDAFDELRFPDGFVFRYPRGFDALEQRLLEAFPSEAKGIRRYMKAMRGMRALADAEERPWPLIKALPKGWLAAVSSGLSLAKFLDSCTQHPRLRAVLAGPHMDYAVAPSRVSLALHLGLMAHYVVDGAYYPRGGGQAIADSLAARIEKDGGKILLRAKVEKILVENGRAVGVEMFNKHTGRRTVRAQVVISDADIKQTFSTLLPRGAVKKKTTERVEKFEMAPAIGVLYLGVKREALPEKLENTNLWLFPGDDSESMYTDVLAGRFSDVPASYVTLTSNKEPDRAIAPDGIVNLQIMTLVPCSPEAWGTTEAAVKDGTYRKDAKYLATKRALTDKLLAQLNGVWPGARAAVVYEEMATPLTHGRYTLSTGGTSYGIAGTVGQFMGKRPAAKTELPGLVLAGASLRTAHGIVGVVLSGRAAARAALTALKQAPAVLPAPRETKSASALPA